MLTDVPEINQNQFMDVLRYTIDTGTNTLVLGPSGGGKTEMCFQIIKEKKCHGIYINMAVLERTDFQGMPVISDDKNSVSYATPEFLPFSDVKMRNKKVALITLLNWVKKQKDTEKNSIGMEKETALALLNKEIKEILDIEEVNELKKCTNYLSLTDFHPLSNKINGFGKNQENDIPIVIIFDEVDKAISEVLQTLLEFLQFRSINGRTLNIQACFLTGNLPDEYAHTNQISHAITKRCSTFKLKVEFDIWKAWAIKNAVSPLILGFLQQNQPYIYKTASDGDETQYALPSPRTWVNVNKVINYFNSDKISSKSDMMQVLRLKLIAGAIGENPAVQFQNWVDHYHTLDPYINDLMDNGAFPDKTKPDMTTQDIFICALSACSKIESSLKPDNKENIEKYVKHAFVWFETLQSDVQIGAIRMVFGGNFDNSKGQEGLIQKYKLVDIPEFTRVFIDISKKLQEYDKLNAAQAEKLNAKVEPEVEATAAE